MKEVKVIQPGHPIAMVAFNDEDDVTVGEAIAKAGFTCGEGIVIRLNEEKVDSLAKVQDGDIITLTRTQKGG